MLTDVHVVILNLNDRAHLLECAGRVLEAGVDPARVHVVDNGSTDDSPEALKQARPEVNVVLTGRNLGYAGGNNVGIRLALEKGARYVLLLNSDAFIRPETVRRLLEAAISKDRVAAVGGLILRRSDMNTVDGAYGVINYRQFLSRLEGEGKKKPGAYRRRLEVDYPYGCMILLSAEAIEEIGLLDVEFFSYHEELEWCHRAKTAGYRILFEPGAVAMHTLFRGNARQAIFKRYMLARNSILFLRKHGTLRKRIRFALFAAVGVPYNIAKWTLTGRGAEAGACLKGYMDGLKKRGPDPAMLEYVSHGEDPTVGKQSRKAEKGSQPVP